MNVFYWLDGASKYFAKNYDVDFNKVKKFLIDEKKIFFCKECEVNLDEEKKGVCNRCRMSKRVLIKFYNLFKDFYDDVMVFLQVEK